VNQLHHQVRQQWVQQQHLGVIVVLVMLRNMLHLHCFALLASCTVVWSMHSISGVPLDSSAMGRHRRRLMMVYWVMVQ
jgi:hypothetical protein